MPACLGVDAERARILSALADLLADMRLGSCTVRDVVERAHVSSAVFDAHFANVEQCALVLQSEAHERICAAMTDAYETRGSWPLRVRRALAALLAFVEDEPALARLCLVDALASTDELFTSHVRWAARFADALDEARGDRTSRGQELSPLTSEGIVGVVAAILHARLWRSDAPSCSELLAPLTSTVVLPYLGPTAARSELCAVQRSP